MNFVTLVGSRDIPRDVSEVLIAVGEKLAMMGYIGRSGFADGADTLFLKGFERVGRLNKFVNYIPWDGFRKKEQPELYEASLITTVPRNVYHEAERIANEIHPAWDKCSRGARALHTRNVCQVLGDDLQTPSKVLYCYTKMDRNGDALGGTRTAWMIAKSYDIPCKNLSDEKVMEDCLKWLGR